MLWIGVQSGTLPGHAKILKSRVKSGKDGRNRRRAEPQSICDSCFVPITCGSNGRGPALDADPQSRLDGSGSGLGDPSTGADAGGLHANGRRRPPNRQVDQSRMRLRCTDPLHSAWSGRVALGRTQWSVAPRWRLPPPSVVHRHRGAPCAKSAASTTMSGRLAGSGGHPGGRRRSCKPAASSHIAWA